MTLWNSIEGKSYRDAERGVKNTNCLTGRRKDIAKALDSLTTLFVRGDEKITLLVTQKPGKARRPDGSIARGYNSAVLLSVIPDVEVGPHRSRR